MEERVVLETPDQVSLVGSFVHGDTGAPLVILAHMLPADRTSWHAFQNALLEKGIDSLAIDLRGHGDSVFQSGVAIDYHTFGSAEHQAGLIDLQAAFQWAIGRGYDPKRIGLGGASIGANLCLQLAAQEHSIRAMFLLSPGENYHGVETFAVATRLASSQAILIVASMGDDQASADASTQLMERVPSLEKQFIPFVTAGHGTSLFQSHPELVSRLTDWLRQQFA